MLDRRERDTVRFYDSNGLIDDAMAAERERKLANPWTDEEKKIFIEKYESESEDVKSEDESRCINTVFVCVLVCSLSSGISYTQRISAK